MRLITAHTAFAFRVSSCSAGDARYRIQSPATIRRRSSSVSSSAAILSSMNCACCVTWTSPNYFPTPKPSNFKKQLYRTNLPARPCRGDKELSSSAEGESLFPAWPEKSDKREATRFRASGLRPASAERGWPSLGDLLLATQVIVSRAPEAHESLLRSGIRNGLLHLFCECGRHRRLESHSRSTSCRKPCRRHEQA